MKCFGSTVKVYRCKIVLLDETELIQEIKESQKGQDILDIVFKHLDLLETVYFGLRFIDSKGYYCWLEPNKNAIKQVKEIEPITFYFGVKFYASDPCKLREECTRYQFFLQIKQDIQQSRLSVTNELAAQLLAYIIQSELGDYDPKIHQYGYVSEFCWIENQSLDFENKVCDLHKKLIGHIPASVEMQFLERIKWLDLYGCELHSVVAEDRHEYFLGLGPHGIIVLKNKLKIGYYYWPSIEKVWCKGKYFMIKVIDRNNRDKTYGFEMLDRNASFRIYKSCKNHKEFFKLSQSNKGQNLLGQLDSTNKSIVRLINQDFNRPNPSLVRISSRRFKRTGKPDGSEVQTINDDRSRHKNNAFENKPMHRFNSIPSLPKANSGTDSGLFSKSASASPLSVRSAFVARYDYGRMNYVSPMKRNASSSSLRRMRLSSKSDNESQVSRVSKHSSKSYQHNDRHYGSDINSPYVHRSKRKYYIEPRMVEWNDNFDKRQNMVHTLPNPKQCSSAVVKKCANKVLYNNDSDSELEMDKNGRYLHYNKTKMNGHRNVPTELQKYIFHEPVDATGLTEMEKKNIHFTKIRSEYTSKYNRPMYDEYSGLNSQKRNLLYNENNKKYNRINEPIPYPAPMDNGMAGVGNGFSYEKSINNETNNCVRYYFDQRNVNLINLNHSSPRVTFVPSHSTAYYSNNDDYKRNLYNANDHQLINGKKDLANNNNNNHNHKTANEISTEL